MLNLYLCDDEQAQLSQLNKTIEDEIEKNGYDMKVELSCTSPESLLDCIKKGGNSTNLYFLDIDLHSSINGIELAQQIRHFDPRAFIVLVTAHSEYMPLTFSYMIEPLAYILKNNLSNMKNDINNCLKLAWERYLLTQSSKPQKTYFSVSTKTRTIDFDTDDLYYITISSTPHILEICSKDRLTQVRGSINESITKLPDNFIKISRETIINTKHIKKFDKEEKSLTLTNDSFFHISTRKYRELKKDL